MVLALLPYSTLDLKSVSLYSAQIYADSISKSWNSIKALKRRLNAVCYWNVSDNDDNWVLKSQPIWVTQYVCLFPYGAFEWFEYFLYMSKKWFVENIPKNVVEKFVLKKR